MTDFTAKLSAIPRLTSTVCAIIVTVVSWFTMMRGYDEPKGFFWDESYHVASAQKYLNDVFFMEPHPPLGKLLIAAGEAILDKNQDDGLFLDVSQAKNPPDSLNLEGYRFFPALLGWLSAPLFYLIALTIVGNPMIAIGLSSLYIFDNAIIVHNRGAMLEGTQIFFALATTIFALSIEKVRNFRLVVSILSGVFFALTINTKVNGFIFFAPVLLCSWVATRKVLPFIKLISVAALSSVLVSILIWGITYAHSFKINPKLENSGYFTAQPDFKSALDSGDPFSPHFLNMWLRDQYAFFHKYEKGVPELNVCKKTENGSYPLLWPLGGSTINYRSGSGGPEQQYLYLIPNPAIWAVALLTMIASFSIFFCWLLGLISLRNTPYRLWMWLFLYVVYMVMVLNVQRVLYLYHYFIPLLLCHFMAAEFFNVTQIKAQLNPNRVLIWILKGIPFVCIACFLFFKPLTYFEKIKKESISKYSWFNLWDVVCNGCDSEFPIGRPVVESNAESVAKRASLTISGVRSSFISQEWGEPKVNRTVEGQEIVIAGDRFERGYGVHAFSRIVFPVNSKFSTFRSFVGLPDYLKGKGGSVVFQVLGDSQLLWQSKVIHPGQRAEMITVPIFEVRELVLQVKDAGDGNDFDHAVWILPEVF